MVCFEIVWVCSVGTYSNIFFGACLKKKNVLKVLNFILKTDILLDKLSKISLVYIPY